MNKLDRLDLDLVQIRVGKFQYAIEMALSNGYLRVAKYFSNKLLVNLNSRILALEIVLYNSSWLIKDDQMPLNNSVYNFLLDSILVLVMETLYYNFSGSRSLNLVGFCRESKSLVLNSFIDRCFQSLILLVLNLWVKSLFSRRLLSCDFYLFQTKYKPAYFVRLETLILPSAQNINLWYVQCSCQDLYQFLSRFLEGKFKMFLQRNTIYFFVSNYRVARLLCFYTNEYFSFQNYDFLEKNTIFNHCYEFNSRIRLREFISYSKFLAKDSYSPNSLICNLSKLLYNFSKTISLSSDRKYLVVLRKFISLLVFRNLVRIYRFKYPLKGSANVKYKDLVHLIRKYHWLFYTSYSIRWWAYHCIQSDNFVFLFYP